MQKYIHTKKNMPNAIDMNAYESNNFMIILLIENVFWPSFLLKRFNLLIIANNLFLLIYNELNYPYIYHLSRLFLLVQ